MPIYTEEKSPCPECGGNVVLDDKHGETYCQKCGLVIQKDMIEEYIPLENDKSTREPPSEKILPQIVFGQKDIRGQRVDQKVGRMRKTAAIFNLNPSERQRLKIMREINRICSVSELPETVVDRAGYVYGKVVSTKTISKPSMKDLTVATILIACREQNIFIDIQDFCNRHSSEKKTVMRYYHIICRNLNVMPNTPSVENYIIKFIQELEHGKLDKNIEKEAMRVCKLYKNVNVNPKCVAAAIVYIAYSNKGIFITQKRIKDVANISEVTIRKRKDEILATIGEVEKVPLIIEKIKIDDIED